MKNKFYLCIDLKSFYASVECAERGLNPMTTNLVVADPDRSDKTICLAVSPNLKKLGVKNRCRVFEIPESISYIMAPPQMKKYIEYSANIYGLYLDYFDKEDIHVYSIDEVFIDITGYLNLYKMNPIELAKFLIKKIKQKFKINATCGIGTNLYLAKVALDITAKHSKNFIGYLDEEIFKKTLWSHQPLSDFWRIGKGTQKKLNELGIYTLEQVANTNSEVLFKVFGVDAELLIDHANGIEPVTIKDIKEFKPESLSFSNGQVLMRDYQIEEAEIILREMTYDLFLKCIQENLVTSNITVNIRYSSDSSNQHDNFSLYFSEKTNNYNDIIDNLIKKFYEKINYDNKIKKINVSVNELRKLEKNQLSFFNPLNNSSQNQLEKTILNLKKRYGKNAVLKGLNLLDSSTSIERHKQIGGHKSGE